MKKLLILSAVAAAVFATSANAAELNVSLTVTESGYDTVELVTVHDDLDLKWISGTVTDQNGKQVYMGQKRPNATENLGFEFTPEDEKTRNYKAVVSLIGKDNSKTLLEKEFTYYTYAEIQQAIADVLSGVKTFEQVKDILSIQFNELYTAINNGSLIVSEMNAILAGDDNVSHEDFLAAFDRALVKAALKNKNASTVKYIIDNCRDIVGITDDMTEKAWFDSLSTQANVIAKIAQLAYDDENAFLQSFKRNVFLEKVNAQHSSTIISFLRQNNSKYYDEANALFALDFNYFDTTLTSAAKKEYAGVLLAKDTYDKSTLAKLDESFKKAINDAKNYQPPTGGGGGSGSSGGSGGGGGAGFSYAVETVIPSENTNANTAGGGFTDINEAEWARTQIEYCVKNGIVNGKSSTEFCPNDLITREEFTAIIVRAFKIQATGEAEFADVDKNAWYYDSIKAAYSNGVIAGYGDTFGVGNNITRQDMAVIMYRVAKNNGIDLTAKSERALADIDTASDYAIEAIDAMYKAERINGVSEGIYDPLANATRAQAVVLIYNLMN